MNKGVIGASLVGLGVLVFFMTRRASVVIVDLVVGNNTIVFEGSTRDIAPAFVGYEDKIIAVWHEVSSGVWLGYDPSAPDWANDLKQLVKGGTYIINAAVDFQWRYTK
jgi:hypothetical protein